MVNKRERERVGDKRINRYRKRSIQIRIRRGHRTGLRSDTAAEREKERVGVGVGVVAVSC